jgi:hypothetical protein
MTRATAPSRNGGADIPTTTEDSMTTQTRTRPASVTAYYLGRPAAFWLAALAPRTRRTSC